MECTKWRWCIHQARLYRTKLPKKQCRPIHCHTKLMDRLHRPSKGHAVVDYWCKYCFRRWIYRVRPDVEYILASQDSMWLWIAKFRAMDSLLLAQDYAVNRTRKQVLGQQVNFTGRNTNGKLTPSRHNSWRVQWKRSAGQSDALYETGIQLNRVHCSNDGNIVFETRTVELWMHSDGRNGMNSMSARSTHRTDKHSNVAGRNALEAIGRC